MRRDCLESIRSIRLFTPSEAIDDLVKGKLVLHPSKDLVEWNVSILGAWIVSDRFQAEIGFIDI